MDKYIVETVDVVDGTHVHEFYEEAKVLEFVARCLKEDIEIQYMYKMEVK